MNSSIFIGMRWDRERRNVLQSLGSMHGNAGFLGFALENACAWGGERNRQKAQLFWIEAVLALRLPQR
jgi:hypothetical protein